jgi:hypothetical protein
MTSAELACTLAATFLSSPAVSGSGDNAVLSSAMSALKQRRVSCRGALRSGVSGDAQHRNDEFSHDSPTKDVTGTLSPFFLLAARYLQLPNSTV